MRAIHRDATSLTLTYVIAVATLAIGLLAAALVYAGPAWAHAARIASDPAENAELTQPPARVSATFNETMQAQFAAMTVVGPDGTQWADGQPTVDDAVISIGVRADAPSGAYTVNYRATSADGHVVSGSWSYRLTTAETRTPTPVSATATPAAAPAPPSSGGLPVWPFVAGTTALVAAGAIWAVRRRT